MEITRSIDFKDTSKSAGENTGAGARTHGSSFEKLLSDISAHAEIDLGFKERIDAVRDYLVNPLSGSQPFLTVMLRTQGRRIEPLKDALLCLAAQTDQDFNVIVLEHNAAKNEVEEVENILARQPSEFASRIKLINVPNGSRAKPLNVGLAQATGRYIAVYDDDDLVFANWVENFHEASITGDGRLLRSVVANQRVRPEDWPQGQRGFRTVSLPTAEYPAEFHQLPHLLVNYSPFMSWGFPRELFLTYGLRFDEELLVCEDWDLILQGSLLCGVEEAKSLTAIYRRWVGGQSSYTSHSTESWRGSEQRVIDRINSRVMMLPPGSMQEIRDLITFNDALKTYRFLFKGGKLRLPVLVGWQLAAPGFRLAVRLRRKISRARNRRRSRS